MPQKAVLHLIDHIGAGGAQSMLRRMIDANEQDFYYFILREKQVSSQPIDLPHVFYSGSEWKYSIKPLLRLKKLISQKNINILHCHLPRSQVFGFLLKRFFFPDLKLVFHEHGKAMEKSLIRKLFFRLVAHHVDAYVAVSIAVADALKTLIPAGLQNNVAVIPNFIDCQKFTPIAADEKRQRRTIFDIPKDSFVVGYVGRLVPEKGIDLFLKSLQELTIPYFAVIAGNGKWEQQARKLVTDAGLNDKVLFLDFAMDVRVVYGTLDLLVIPSRREAFCLTALEAQAMRIPVVATGVGGLREILQFDVNAVEINPVDQVSVATAIEKVYSSIPLREMLMKNGPQNAAQFSYSNFIQRLRELYSARGW